MESEINTLFGLMTILIKSAEELKQLIKKNSIKKDLKIALEIPINDFAKALDELIISFYQIFGASFAGFFMKPINYELTSDKIIDSFSESLSNLEKKAIILIEDLKTHEESLKEISGKDWVKYEILFNCIDENGIKYDYLFRSNQCKKSSYFDPEFIDLFSQKLNDYNEENLSNRLPLGEIEKFAKHTIKSNFGKNSIKKKLNPFTNRRKTKFKQKKTRQTKR